MGKIIKFESNYKMSDNLDNLRNIVNNLNEEINSYINNNDVYDNINSNKEEITKDLTTIDGIYHYYYEMKLFFENMEDYKYLKNIDKIFYINTLDDLKRKKYIDLINRIDELNISLIKKLELVDNYTEIFLNEKNLNDGDKHENRRF